MELPVDTDFGLVGALRAGRTGAREALFDRYGRLVRSVLLRILGRDAELVDLLHDVFVTAFESIERLEDPGRLRQWLTSIAVFSARARIRRRQRLRLALFSIGNSEKERTVDSPDTDAGEAARCVYVVLDRMPEAERICFSLRFLMGMEVQEIADALRVSHATAKRRIAAARMRFDRLAAEHAALRPWLEGDES